MLYLLFGEMGVGKNYVGEKLAKYLGCKFYDGDCSMPIDMKRKVENFGFLSKEILDRFVESHLIRDIRKLLPYECQENLVVGQALYAEKYRQIVWNNFPSARLFYVVPPSLRVHLSRIMARPRGFRWALYFLMSKPFFQDPGERANRIVNDTDENIYRQIAEILDQDHE